LATALSLTYSSGILLRFRGYKVVGGCLLIQTVGMLLIWHWAGFVVVSNGPGAFELACISPVIIGINVRH
jgi:hypothetical protein